MSLEYSKRNTFLVGLISLVITIILGAAIWNMNHWPNDTEGYYFKAAIDLPQMKYLSQMHESVDGPRSRWLHGKEIFILLCSLAQRLLNDIESLKPFILVCLISTYFSLILVYLIARDYWGEKVAWFCYFLLASSFWTYLYVLFTKHTPTGMMFALLAIYLVSKGRMTVKGYAFYLLSGVSMAAAIFSSTVSPFYVPYLAAAFLINQYGLIKQQWSIKKFIQNIFINGVLIIVGSLVILMYVTAPDLLRSIDGYFSYSTILQSHSHFFYNQPILQQWISGDIASTRGGIIWILKYLMLVLPVIFPLYIVCIAFLIWRIVVQRDFKNKITAVGFIILSISTPLMIEWRIIPQYGSNYFPVFLGLLVLISYAAFCFLNDKRNSKQFTDQRLLTGILCIAILQVGVNFFVFLTDIYPTRMATKFLSDAIKKLNISKIYTYQLHPNNLYIAGQLSPDVKKSLQIIPIKSLTEVEDGYVLVPPITEDSIYHAAKGSYTYFDLDLLLNELIQQKAIEKYAVLSLPSIISSKVWAQEAENTTYRYLVLNQFTKESVEAGRMWILDAKKLSQDKNQYMPSMEKIVFWKNAVQDIGRLSKFYVYKGTMTKINQRSLLTQWQARIFKEGNPQDSLVAYAFIQEPVEKEWVPAGKYYASLPISASQLTENPLGSAIQFQFTEPILVDGPLRIQVYRTGKQDDDNFYRIYAKDYQPILK